MDWRIQIRWFGKALAMAEEKREAMCLGILNGVRWVNELQRCLGGRRRMVNGVFGVAEKWGKGRSFVEQDKASAVQCRRSVVFSNILTAFPPLQAICTGQQHSTAKSTLEQVVPRLHFKGFR